MNRRQFVSSSGIAALALGRPSAAAPVTPAASAKPVLMKLGCQSAPTNDAHLSYLARYGVKNICGYPATATGRDDTAWASVEALSRMKDLATKHGITVDCAGPPLLESSYIDKEK